MSDLVLAIDQGTTSTRAVLFNAQGEILEIAQKELTLHYPHNGWVEQNAEEIWEDTQRVCAEAVANAGVDIAQIRAIGITNQRETVVVWDKDTGTPVYNAIVWQDRRTADFCARLKADGLEALLQAKTGLLADPYFSASKVRWILDHVEGARERAEKGELLLGTIDSFLLWRLTGGAAHATDMTNASRTQLFNIVDKQWDSRLLEIFGVPASMLPEVKDNSCLFGTTTLLGREIPITGMAGDQQAALFGQACFEQGMVKSTYGTGCFALVNIGSECRVSKNKLLTTVAYSLNGHVTYAIEGSIFIAGAAVQWLRDGLGVIQSAGETEALALSVPDTNGVYLVPAFTGLGAPYWDPEARGALVGLTRASGKAHIVRAALEAQAYQTEDLMAAMEQDSRVEIKELRVDGGMVNNGFVCQFLADITGKRVLRPTVVETTVLGAAYLAGLQVGVFTSLEHIQKTWQCQQVFDSKIEPAVRNRLYAGWKQAVERVRQ